MNVPLYGQRNPAWAGQLINNVKGSTIGGYGCTLTCIGMISGRNPSQQETFMRVIGAFTGDLVLWTKTPGFKSRFYCEETPAPLEAIKAEIRAGRPVLANVHLGMGTPKPNHWVLIVDENFTINDPWYEETVSITKRYGKTAAIAILGGAYFNPQTNLNPNDMSQADRDELAWLRTKWQEVKSNKSGCFRVTGSPDIFQVYHVPSWDHMNSLGNTEADITNLPSNWPTPPSEWADQRSFLQPRVDELTSVINTVNTALEDAKKTIIDLTSSNLEYGEKIDELQDTVESKELEIKDLQDQLAAVADQPAPTAPNLETSLKLVIEWFKNLITKK